MASLPYVIFISSFFLCHSCKTFCLLERNESSAEQGLTGFPLPPRGELQWILFKASQNFGCSRGAVDRSGILAPSMREIARNSFKAKHNLPKIIKIQSN
jgi:hypothetical protein